MTDNPFDQFDAPAAPAGGQGQPATNPFDQFDNSPHGQKTWSASPFSLVPASGYADGSWDWDSNAGMPGVAKRVGQAAYGAIKNLPNLAHEAGAETAANTATPATAGQSLQLAGLATSGDMVVPGMAGPASAVAKSAAAVPTAAELKATGAGQLQAMRDLGVHYDTDHVSAMTQGAQDALTQKGLSNETSPGAAAVHSVLNKLGNPGPEAVSVPIGGLVDARSILGRIRVGQDPSGRAAAAQAIPHIDNFIQNLVPEAVLAGPAADAANLLKTGNANYAAGMRSDKLNAKGDYAQFKADSAHSGANFDNTLRQQVTPLLDPSKPQRLAGFTGHEKAAVARIPEGSYLRNGLRTASSYMGGGGGGVAAIQGLEYARAGNELAGPIGGAVGAAVPFVGRGLRAAENGMARSALTKADELIRSRSPLNEERQATAPMQRPTAGPGAASVRAAAASQPPDAPTTGAPVDPNQFYAKGGAVKKPTHEFLVQRLMKLAEKAKKAEKKVTKPILSMNDDTVTAALAKAQAAL